MDNIERQIDEFVLPGDTIALSSLPSPLDSTSSIILGPGLHYDKDTCAFTSHACGHIREPSSLTYYVDGHRPGASSLSNGDLVLGIVVRRQLETLLVDIGYNELASLSLYDFEGSTKRTKPNVDRGDVIYGQLKMDGECQPQITCINEDGKADGMGVLHENGYLFGFHDRRSSDRCFPRPLLSRPRSNPNRNRTSLSVSPLPSRKDVY
jgi:exosome complex component RRP40